MGYTVLECNTCSICTMLAYERKSINIHKEWMEILIYYNILITVFILLTKNSKIIKIKNKKYAQNLIS